MTASITAMPTPPSRSQAPDVFAAQADVFLAALPQFASEANALAGEVSANAAAAGSSAVAAAGSASTANTAQLVATAAANFKGDYSAGVTYQVGHSCAYGGKRWAAKTINAGVTPAAGANWMELPVVTSMPRLARTSNVMLTTADNGALLDVTGGTFTQTFDTAANLLAGWYCLVRNSGNGAITLALSTSIVLYPGQMRLVQCDGGTIRSFHLAGRREMVVRDEKSSGTRGGVAAAGAYATRTLNTVVVNTIDGAALSANQITLPAGRYSILASVPGFLVNRFRGRLYDVTGAAVLLLGSSEFAGNTAAIAVRSVIAGTISLSTTSSVRLEMRAEYSAGSAQELGESSGFGDAEVYSELTIERID